MPRLLLLLSLVLAARASAQAGPSRGEGRPFFSRHVTWQEYGGSSQNWAVAQRPDGLVYVANTEGVLEYDGAGWRLYSLPDEARSLVRSLAVGPSSRVYVGGVGDFGFLAPDTSGTLAYRSLVPLVAARDRSAFTDVWTTHATRGGVVFQSSERLFRWDGRRMETWRTDTRFRTSFLVRGDVYVWEDGVGVKALGSRGLALVPGGGAFAERKVDALLPYGRGGFLAVVRDEGLVVLGADGRSWALPGPASEYLVAHRPYSAIAVPDAYSGRGVLYAVATSGGGVVLVTPGGRVVRVYREDVGLGEGDDAIGLQVDRQGGLWVALQNGLTRIDLAARHTWFDEGD
ncbi:MAG TPA: histidine kinase, partial [Rubricoccaceae bacterium]